MINRIAKRNLLFRFVGMFMIASLISVLAFSSTRHKLKRPPQQTPHTKEWLSSIPPVRSKVKDLEIVNERIVRPNTELPGVAFEILNKSHRAVMAVRITCGDAAISSDGLDDEANPKVLIEPYGTLTAEMSGSELTPEFPIVINSATFQDGKEEGNAFSVEMMQRIRKRERARHKAEREKQSSERRPNQ